MSPRSVKKISLNAFSSILYELSLSTLAKVFLGNEILCVLCVFCSDVQNQKFRISNPKPKLLNIESRISKLKGETFYLAGWLQRLRLQKNTGLSKIVINKIDTVSNNINMRLINLKTKQHIFNKQHEY